MKLILFASLLCLALSSPFYFRVPAETQVISDSAPSCISDYFTGFFAKFGLEQPKQIIQCFDEKSAALYFKHIYEVAHLTKDAEDRKTVQVHLDWLKLLAFHKALDSVHSCIGQTEDIKKLLEVFGAKEHNHHLFMLAKYIYYQANFGVLSERLSCLTGALDEKNFTKAGYIAGCITNKTVSEIKSRGLALEALNGFWNGVHIALGLPDAESVWGCWNNETAAIRLKFIYGLSAAVSGGKWKDASYNTEKYYEEHGKELIEKIPKDAWKCWKESDDTKAESAQLKTDITSPDFYEKVAKFVHGHQASYWHLQKTIKENMDDHNFNHAGNAYGHLLQAVVAAK
jgi:Fe-S cluster biosynthesis and repair protein YggX